MSWNRKDFLEIRRLREDELRTLLDTTSAMKAVLQRPIKKIPALRGKTVVNLFVEPSTRTRTSFEIAANRLSADVMNFASEASSFRKGETLKDTALTLQALSADIVILRHKSAGAAQFLSERLDACVVNAGDGAHAHPTQALLDVFTMEEKVGDLKGKKVAIIGDILFSRVARSNIWALTKLGAEVTLVGPSTLLPRTFESTEARVVRDLDEILPEVDVVYLLRIQNERQRAMYFPSIGEYVSNFGLTTERMARCKSDVVIMHPGPINRGVEIASEVADGPNSVVLDQVTNGQAARMAILYLISGGKAVGGEGGYQL